MAVIVINPYQYAAPIGPSADPYSDYVSLLLHGNGANNSTIFIDSSSHNHTVTANDDAKISTTESKFGGASMYFDWNGDYLSIPDDTSIHLGSDNFTFEFWTYLNSTNGHFINKRASTSANVQYLYFTLSEGTLLLYATSNGSSWDIASNFDFGNTTLSTGQWYHIALVRNGTEIATYVNGIKSPNTITTSAAIHNGSTNPLRICGDVSYNNYLNGYIDDFRLTKGVARYISNFTPPTVELPDPSDPNFSSVSLLLHGNGANGSTAFTDSSSYIHTVTPTGDAEISTTQSKFGGASMYFDGSGDYLTATDSSFAFGTGEFTVEFWMRAVSTATFEGLLSTGNVNTTDSWQISGGTNLAFGSQSGPSVGDTFPSLNTWHHVAVVRDASSVVTMYINGTNVDSATDTNDYSANNLKIGTNRAVDNFYDGYIDDLRITKGVARYTSNFTPPTAPLPDETPLIVTDGLVLNLDAGDNVSYPGTGNTWYDLSGNENDGTLVNGVGYDSNNGGSLVFDGVNDYVSNVNPGLSDAQVEGELTYEYWLQPTQAIYSSFTQSTSGTAYFDPGTPQGLTSSTNYEYSNEAYASFMFAFGTNGFVAAVHNFEHAPTFLVDYKPYTGVSHLTVIKSAYGCSYYINGVFKKSATQSRILGVVPDRVTSDSSTYFGRYFKGNIYSYRFYNKALTPSEITQNYNALRDRYGL